MKILSLLILFLITSCSSIKEDLIHNKIKSVLNTCHNYEKSISVAMDTIKDDIRKEVLNIKNTNSDTFDRDRINKKIKLYKFFQVAKIRDRSGIKELCSISEKMVDSNDLFLSLEFILKYQIVKDNISKVQGFKGNVKYRRFNSNDLNSVLDLMINS